MLHAPKCQGQREEAEKKKGALVICSLAKPGETVSGSIHRSIQGVFCWPEDIKGLSPGFSFVPPSLNKRRPVCLALSSIFPYLIPCERWTLDARRDAFRRSGRHSSLLPGRLLGITAGDQLPSVRYRYRWVLSAARWSKERSKGKNSMNSNLVRSRVSTRCPKRRYQKTNGIPWSLAKKRRQKSVKNKVNISRSNGPKQADARGKKK